MTEDEALRRDLSRCWQLGATEATVTEVRRIMAGESSERAKIEAIQHVLETHDAVLARNPHEQEGANR